MKMEEQIRVAGLTIGLTDYESDAVLRAYQHNEKCKCGNINGCETPYAQGYRESCIRADNAIDALFSLLGVSYGAAYTAYMIRAIGHRKN